MAIAVIRKTKLWRCPRWRCPRWLNSLSWVILACGTALLLRDGFQSVGLATFTTETKSNGTDPEPTADGNAAEFSLSPATDGATTGVESRTAKKPPIEPLSSGSGVGISEASPMATTESPGRENPWDFSYDREGWGRPRIVLLAGPHKTASTTIQKFFYEVAGYKFSIGDNPTNPKNQVVPSTDEWVWPSGSRMRKRARDKTVILRAPRHKYKLYANMASFISGRRKEKFFGALYDKDMTQAERDEAKDKVVDFFRMLFRRPWDEGKKVVIGAEAFDSLVWRLHSVGDAKGEAMHVDPQSSEAIDQILNFLPWDNATTAATSTTSGGNPPLRLEDIEVQINLRTPRIRHVISVWHQLGMGRTLRSFLRDTSLYNLYQTNSVALALQFVRRGIKTTIIDMAGVSQWHTNDVQIEQNETIVGGIRGVIACDVLQMNLCDDKSQLHLSDYKHEVDDQNRKSDKRQMELTDEQLEEIGRVLDEYDCSVWKHLQKYQAKGILRILYPTKDLFATCIPDEIHDVSFETVLRTIYDIAGRENGIPKTKTLRRQGKRAKATKAPKASKATKVFKARRNGFEGEEEGG